MDLQNEIEKKFGIVKIDNSSFSNDYKNIGILLEGQLRFNEAAEVYVEAFLVNPEDCRPLEHLEALLDSQPELKCEFAELLRFCRQAVDYVQKELQIEQIEQMKQEYNAKTSHPN